MLKKISFETNYLIVTEGQYFSWTVRKCKVLLVNKIKDKCHFTQKVTSQIETQSRKGNWSRSNKLGGFGFI